MTHLLTHLRRALPVPQLLAVTEDHIMLDPSRVWSDVAAFERLSADRAVALYRGPFLAGFSLPESAEFESWAGQERRACEELYLKALMALIEERAAGGDYAAAIAYARRYLETDDLAEDVHRRLIELYAAAGDRGAALRQFEHCVTVMERELGVSPLPETRAVYQAILEGRSYRPQRPVASPTWATLPGLRAPLIGREEALARLQQAYVNARLGRGGVILISGEAGIGKSRLMQEFATGLADQALVLAGVSYPGGKAIPYQPIVQALRGVLSRRAEEGSGGKFSTPASPLPYPSAQSWLAEATRLLPELRVLYPNLPPPLMGEPDEARARLFEALCQIMLGLATSPLTPFTPSPLSSEERGEGARGSRVRSLLLCLDDLHWADGATLDWLAYLGPRLRRQPVLVIGAYRSEEADAVAGLRHNLARLGVLAELRLTGLDVASVHQLLRHLTHSPLRPSLSSGEGEGRWGGEAALAARLQAITGGNPFFLLEVLKALLETGRLPGGLGDIEDLPLPDTVREAIEARLQRLSPRARQILEIVDRGGSSLSFPSRAHAAGSGGRPEPHAAPVVASSRRPGVGANAAGRGGCSGAPLRSRRWPPTPASCPS